jgi:phosphotransferase system IIB component
MKSELERQQNSPQAIINVVSDVLDYGKDFPYGVHSSESSIDNITLKKCEEYYSTYFRPNISDLAIVGDMTLKEAKSLTEKYFGSWEKSEIPKIEYKIPQQPDSTKVILVDRPNSTRVDINVTYPVLLKIGSDDVIKSAVMNTILGAENFRLFDDLTKEHKYAYGVFSNLSQDEYVGNFTITTSVKSSYTDSTISQILYEMKKIRNSQVSEEELQKAKNYLIGNFALALEQPQTVAAFIVNLDKYNLSSNYYTDYLKNTSQVTKQDVQNEAEKYIKPNNAYIVVVGNADQISDGLKQFGPVYLYDKDGNKIGNTTIEIPKGLTGEKVIDNYINALGGKINLDKVKDRTTIMTGNVRGREITMTIYQKAPDKMKQDILAGPYNQDVYFDGVNGIMKVADKTLEVKGAELEKLKYESTLDLLTHIDSLGIKLKLEGTANVAGKNAYKVAMIFPSGTKWIQYYAADTWLKIKESKNISVPQGTFTEETYMGDYHEVDGVKYPFSLKQSIGSQQLNFTVSSIKINTGLSDSIFVIK